MKRGKFLTKRSKFLTKRGKFLTKMRETCLTPSLLGTKRNQQVLNLANTEGVRAQSLFAGPKSAWRLSCVKTMFVIFDWQGVIHKEFVPEGENINAVYYKGVMERLLNRIRPVRPGMCESGEWFLLHDKAPSHNTTISSSFWPNKSDCAWPPSVFARFSTCSLLFVPKSENPLEGATLWLDFGHPESRDKYIKHHCKGRLLQRHPEAVRPCKSVCTVRSDVCRKLNNKSVISFTQILFIMPVVKLSRLTVQYRKLRQISCLYIVNCWLQRLVTYAIHHPHNHAE